MLSDLSAATCVLSVDPGREKCGLALVSLEGRVLQRQIVGRGVIVAEVVAWWQTHHPDVLLIGHATGRQQLANELREALPNVSVLPVDERNSTLEARALYWAEHPPQGLQRLIPLSLQVPPVPLDDFAAVVLAQRYLQELESKKQSVTQS